jgi:ABC-2 type transport system ATP-binding protein
MAIIEAVGLARVFKSRRREVQAVRGVDITVAEGEIVGFLGPNGAGKTTMLRMLTTLLKPTAGTATVAGADLFRDPLGVRRRIGYVPQAIGATGGGTNPNCLVGEELRLQARLYRIPASEAAGRTRLLLDQLELTGLEDRLCKTLSGGQDADWTSRSGSSTRPASSFSTSRRPGLTRRAAAISGSTSVTCVRSWGQPSSLPHTTLAF